MMRPAPLGSVSTWHSRRIGYRQRGVGEKPLPLADASSDQRPPGVGKSLDQLRTGEVTIDERIDRYIKPQHNSIDHEAARSEHCIQHCSSPQD